MQHKERERLSRIRQALRGLTRELQTLLPDLADRLPMVKGSVYEQRRKCGKPTCGCAGGKLHSTRILSRSEGGRTRLISISTDQVAQLQVLTARYQRFRRARARLGQIYKTMLSLIDELEASRLKEP
jgi:hypothetical protein